MSADVRKLKSLVRQAALSFGMCSLFFLSLAPAVIRHATTQPEGWPRNAAVSGAIVGMLGMIVFASSMSLRLSRAAISLGE